MRVINASLLAAAVEHEWKADAKKLMSGGTFFVSASITFRVICLVNMRARNAWFSQIWNESFLCARI